MGLSIANVDDISLEYLARFNRSSFGKEGIDPIVEGIDKVERECIVFGIARTDKEGLRLKFMQTGSTYSLEDLSATWSDETHTFPEIFRDDDSYRALKRKIIPYKDGLDVSKERDRMPYRINLKPFSIEGFDEGHIEVQGDSVPVFSAWDLVFKEKGYHAFTIGYNTTFGLRRFNRLTEEMNIYGPKMSVAKALAVLREHKEFENSDIITPFLHHVLYASEESTYPEHIEIISHHPSVVTYLESTPSDMPDEVFGLRRQVLVRCHDFTGHENGYIRIQSHVPYTHCAWKD